MEELAQKARAELGRARSALAAVDELPEGCHGSAKSDDAAALMGQAVLHVAQVLRPTKTSQMARQEVIDDVNRALAGDALCAGLSAVAYGSFVCDLDLPGSDLDLALGGHLTLLAPILPAPAPAAAHSAESTPAAAQGVPAAAQAAGDDTTTAAPATVQPEQGSSSTAAAESSNTELHTGSSETVTAPKSTQVVAAEAWAAGTAVLNPWHYVMAEAAGKSIGSPVSLEALSPPEIRRLLAHVADLVEAAGCAGPHGVMRVLEARVPIIKYRHARTGVSVDICCGARGKAFKGLVVAQLNRLCPLLPPLYRLVKLWAQMHSLNDASDGTFNSWSLTLMAIFALQTIKPALLPPLWQVLSAVPPPPTSAPPDTDEDPLCPSPPEPPAPPQEVDDDTEGPPLLQAAEYEQVAPAATSTAALGKPLYTFDVEVDEEGEAEAGAGAGGEEGPLGLETIKEGEDTATVASGLSAVPSSSQTQGAACDAVAAGLADMKLAATGSAGTDIAAGSPVVPEASGSATVQVAGCESQKALSLDDTAVVVGPEGWRLLAHPRASEQQLAQALSHCAAWCTEAERAGWGGPAADGAGLLDALHWFFSLFYHMCDGWHKGWLRHHRVSVWQGQVATALWPYDYLVGVEEPFDATDNTARSLGTLSRNSGSLPYIVYVLSTSLQLLSAARTQRTSEAVRAALVWLWGEEGVMAMSEPLHQDSTSETTSVGGETKAEVPQQQDKQELQQEATAAQSAASLTAEAPAAPAAAAAAAGLSSAPASMLTSLGMDADQLLLKVYRLLEEDCPPVQIHKMLVEEFGGPAGPLSLNQWRQELQQKQAQQWQEGEQDRQQEREVAAAYWASLGKQPEAEQASQEGARAGPSGVAAAAAPEGVRMDAAAADINLAAAAAEDTAAVVSRQQQGIGKHVDTAQHVEQLPGQKTMQDRCKQQ